MEVCNLKMSAGAGDWQDRCVLPERFPEIPSPEPVGTPSLSVARTLLSSQENSMYSTTGTTFVFYCTLIHIQQIQNHSNPRPGAFSAYLSPFVTRGQGQSLRISLYRIPSN